MNIVSLLLAAWPLLKDYFSKNYGMNSATSGALGAFGVLGALAAQNTHSVDQAITFVSNHGATGLYVAGALVALRAFVAFMAANGK